jgi:hypothetical protein
VPIQSHSLLRLQHLLVSASLSSRSSGAPLLSSMHQPEVRSIGRSLRELHICGTTARLNRKFTDDFEIRAG